MELQRRSVLFLLVLSLLIHIQFKVVGSLDQASVSSIDVKRHHLAVETMSFPGDFVRRQLAGGGGGGGSRGGSSGGGSSGGSSRGGGGGGTSGGGSSNRGGSGGSGGNKGGKGGGSRGGGGDDGGDDGGDSGGGSGSSGNTKGGGRQVPVVPGGRFPSDGVRLQYSFALFIFTTWFILMFY